jgi:hypothetical protein
MSAREDLARLLFTADNYDAEDPDHEWEMTKRHNPSYVHYAYIMADAALAAGYRPPAPRPAEIPVLPGQVTVDTVLGE